MDTLFSERTEQNLKREIVNLVNASVKTIVSQRTVEKRYYNQTEAAKYIGCSYNTLQKLVTSGLKVIRTDGIVRYDIKDIDEYLLTHKI